MSSARRRFRARLVTNLFPNPNLSAEGGASGGPYCLVRQVPRSRASDE